MKRRACLQDRHADTKEKAGNPMKLSGVPETLLIPLWARATEGDRENPIIVDKKSAEMISRIDYDFTKFSKSRLSRVGVCIRTMLLDRAVAMFLENKHEAVIVNLGAGLDTRCIRFAGNGVEWIDLDLPEVITLRKRFFTESSDCSMMASSVFDNYWMERVQRLRGERPMLIVAEGLLMYFDEPVVKELLCDAAEHFPGAEMLLEALAPVAVGRSNFHDSVSRMETSSEFKWGPKDSKIFEAWHPGISLKDEWNYFRYHKKRWGLLGVLARLPFIEPKLSSRIVHLCFAHATAVSNGGTAW